MSVERVDVSDERTTQGTVDLEQRLADCVTDIAYVLRPKDFQRFVNIAPKGHHTILTRSYLESIDDPDDDDHKLAEILADWFISGTDLHALTAESGFDIQRVEHQIDLIPAMIGKYFRKRSGKLGKAGVLSNIEVVFHSAESAAGFFSNSRKVLAKSLSEAEALNALQERIESGDTFTPDDVIFETELDKPAGEQMRVKQGFVDKADDSKIYKIVKKAPTKNYPDKKTETSRPVAPVPDSFRAIQRPLTYIPKPQPEVVSVLPPDLWQIAISDRPTPIRDVEKAVDLMFGTVKENGQLEDSQIASLKQRLFDRANIRPLDDEDRQTLTYINDLLCELEDGGYSRIHESPVARDHLHNFTTVWADGEARSVAEITDDANQGASTRNKVSQTIVARRIVGAMQVVFEDSRKPLRETRVS